jgi:hypothetical protein
MNRLADELERIHASPFDRDRRAPSMGAGAIDDASPVPTRLPAPPDRPTRNRCRKASAEIAGRLQAPGFRK